jgi:hypothetical protein
VLIHALLNEPDVQIAEKLGVSLDAVKKTWRAIYDRVSVALPYWIVDPEELRPFVKMRNIDRIA